MKRVIAAAAVLWVLAAAAAAETRPGRTERISVALDGAQSVRDSLDASVGADGRLVSFESESGLVPADTNASWDVYVRDRWAGTTELVSVGPDGKPATGHRARISANGRFVAFDSTSKNLVPGDTGNTSDVFVRDLVTGTTELVSVATDGTPAEGNSYAPAISADGRFVAYRSVAADIVPGDTDGGWDVFVRDRAAGTSERVSVARDGTQQNCFPVPTSYVRFTCFEGVGFPSAISDDGRIVAWVSLASSLVPGDTNGAFDVFVKDRADGSVERVSVGTDGAQGNGRTGANVALSGDGRHVAFYSLASNLVPEDRNLSWDAFVHDRTTGRTERVSVGSDGREGTCPSDPGCYEPIWPPAISRDGRHVAFMTYASTLVPGDSNGAWDVFVRDRLTGITEIASVGEGGLPANGHANGPALSLDGRHLGFASYASNVVPGDTNGVRDVFLRDRGPANGAGEVSATVRGEEIEVAGWAGFLGETLTAADDPSDDGTGAGQRELGGELTRVSVAHRPERGDLLVRFQLWRMASASLPACAGACPSAGGTPGIVYTLRFTVAGTTYEARATRGEPAAVPPDAPYFALYRCAPLCSEVQRLTGSVGESGHEVLISIPLAALGGGPGVSLTGVEALTTRKVDATGAFLFFDRVTLPDGAVALPSVWLGIAPAGTAVADVPFVTSASLSGGDFAGALDASSLAPGDYDVWARGCLGTSCGAASTGVTVG